MGKMKKIAVLGLGESLKEFNPGDYELSVGVNDIWRYVETDIVVCLDKRSAFNSDRLLFIDNCKPKAFYSQITNWDTRPDFRKIDLLANYPDKVCRINLPSLQKSFCSPFVAVQVAYRYYNGTEIHLFGVDLVNHPNLDKILCSKIKIHFKNLLIALRENGCDMIIHGNGILTDIL